MIKNVCIFSSASNNINEIFFKEASELGWLLGKNGKNVVYGGSRLGTMYACAFAAKNAGAKITGIMPQRLYDIGYGNPEDCDEFIITEGIRERKAKLDECSDAVIALAGGFGTLEEISEMIVQKQLGYNKKPIVLLNTNGYYNELIQFFDKMVKTNFAKPEASKLYYVAETPSDAMDYLISYNHDELTISGVL